MSCNSKNRQVIWQNFFFPVDWAIFCPLLDFLFSFINDSAEK